MYVHPWLKGGWSWAYVHGVWHYWQSLNVGMLAFASSVAIYNASRYNENKRRAREYVAARAFLPEALSSLTEYLESCSPVFLEGWRRSADLDEHGPLESQPPSLPDGHKEVFGKCITHADADIGAHLAYLLARLQISHARMSDMAKDFRDGTRLESPENIMSYLYCLGELQALVNVTYDHARTGCYFEAGHLEWDDYRTAYNNLDIDYARLGDLEGFTKRAVARRES